ncbi:hypothetical protein GCM10010424_64830 [Streptomyces lienomycini]
MRPRTKGWATAATAAATEHSSTSASRARPGPEPSVPSRLPGARDPEVRFPDVRAAGLLVRTSAILRT